MFIVMCNADPAAGRGGERDPGPGEAGRGQQRRPHPGLGQPLRQELREDRRRADAVQCPDHLPPAVER